MEHSYHIALAGNPNVGKSTVFNNLTGLHQHTGNWPGKTVENKTGTFRYNGTEYRITDIPGTYSLNTRSPEEAIAGEFLCSGTADCIVLVCDGGCLERNLLFVLQVLSRVGNCVVCVNLMDEAEKRGVRVDGERFSEMLGCPVVLCAAGVGRGMEALTETIAQAVRSPDKLPRAFPEYGSTFAEQARTIASSCIHTEGRPDARDRRLDRIGPEQVLHVDLGVLALVEEVHELVGEVRIRGLGRKDHLVAGDREALPGQDEFDVRAGRHVLLLVAVDDLAGVGRVAVSDPRRA